MPSGSRRASSTSRPSRTPSRRRRRSSTRARSSPARSPSSSRPSSHYREMVRLTNLRYNSGLANYFEVLYSMQQLFPAEIALARSRLDLLTDFVDIYKALGGGWNVQTRTEIRPGSRPPRLRSRPRSRSVKLKPSLSTGSSSSFRSRSRWSTWGCPPPCCSSRRRSPSYPSPASSSSRPSRSPSDTGDAVGGLLNATFGNAPELIIAWSRSRRATSTWCGRRIIGAILANLLLALGVSFFARRPAPSHPGLQPDAPRARTAR